MSANFEAIIIILIYGRFWVIRKPISEHMICNSYIFIKKNLLSHKELKTELKSL